MKNQFAFSSALSILLAVPPTAAHGQVVADSAKVIVASISAMLGPPPYEHPAGKARTICIDIQPSDAWAQRTWTYDPQFILDSRARFGGVAEVVLTCHSSNGSSRVLGPADQPAVDVTVLGLKFISLDSAVSRFDEARGGPGSRIVECYAKRAETGQEWTIRECKTLLTRPK